MSQQVKSSTPIRLAFEQLEAIDLPFDLTLTPLVGESGQDSYLVALDACGKGTQFWDSTLESFFQPGFKGRRIPATNHLGESLRQLTCYLYLRMRLLS
jgi:hypothetical protein